MYLNYFSIYYTNVKNKLPSILLIFKTPPNLLIISYFIFHVNNHDTLNNDIFHQFLIFLSLYMSVPIHDRQSERDAPTPGSIKGTLSNLRRSLRTAFATSSDIAHLVYRSTELGPRDFLQPFVPSLCSSDVLDWFYCDTLAEQKCRKAYERSE